MISLTLAGPSLVPFGSLRFWLAVMQQLVDEFDVENYAFILDNATI